MANDISRKFEVEEVMADVADASFRERLEWPLDRGRLIIFALATAAMLALFAARIFDLTVLKGSFFASKAEAARERRFPLIPLRGVVYDRFGEPLVENEAGVTVFLDPLFLPEDEEHRTAMFAELGIVLEKPAEEINAAFEAHKGRADLLEIASAISPETAVELSLKDLPGVRVEQSFVRKVNNASALSSVVGYLGASGEGPQGLREGKSGVEEFFNNELAGQLGERLAIVDAFGRVREQKILKGATSGNDVTLSIDAELSEVLWSSLDRMRKSVRSPAAAAVALDPRTGEVLSMVSTPFVDADSLNRGISQKELDVLLSDARNPFLNRAIAGTYPSGSTIKPFVATAALDERVITSKRRIFVTGSISLPSIYDPSVIYTFPDWKAHGSVNMVDALAVSSNVYFYTVGGGFGDIEGLGVERLVDWLSRFGFGKALGIDLHGEAQGKVPTPAWKQETKSEQWFIGDTYNLSIGQGDFAATPLQMATATAVVANGGTLWQPRMALQVKDPFGDVLSEFAPKEISRIESVPEVWDVVRKGMRASVSASNGTNRAMASLPINVAAKTGTAQAPREKLHAWVTAFAPYEEPQIVLAIIIEEGGQGTVATAVAKEVLAWYAENRL